MYSQNSEFHFHYDVEFLQKTKQTKHTQKHL